MNTHQARKRSALYFSILIWGLVVSNLASAQSNPIYYGILGRDTSIVSKAEPGNSFYYDGMLSIPSVDTPEQQSLYQNVSLIYQPDIDAYKLIRVNAVPFTEDLVNEVDLVVTSEQPIQVFLKLSGYFSYSCGNVLVINQTKVKYADKPQYRSQFKVTVTFYNQFLRDNLEASCTTDDKLYTLVLPLQVYGLQAGAYEYAVNDTHTGTFELKSENIVSDDLLKFQSKN